MSIAVTEFLSLESVRDHMDALEGTFIRAQARAFATRQAPASIDRGDLHLRGLRLHIEDARAEAHRRCRSVLYSEAFTGAHVLARLTPGEVLDNEMGVSLPPAYARNRLAVTTAIGAGAQVRARVGDELSVEAASVQRPVPDGLLVAHLGLPEPRAGLLAAIRHPPRAEWALRTLENIVCGSRGETRTLAVLALGRARARAFGAADPAFASWLTHLLGDELFEAPVLIAAALVGNASTAAAIGRRIERDGPTVGLIHALGLVGVPRSVATLARLLASLDPVISEESLRALYMIVGRLFVQGDPEALRDDGRLAEPAPAVAEAFARGWVVAQGERHHLGAPLANRDSRPVPSFAFLGAVASGSSISTVPTLLPGLVADFPRRRGTLFDILPPAPTSEPRTQRPTNRGRET